MVFQNAINQHCGAICEMPSLAFQDMMQLEEKLDRATKGVPSIPLVDKSGLSETWFGYLWKIEPKLFLAETVRCAGLEPATLGS